MAKVQSGESIEDWIGGAPEILVPVLHRLRESIHELQIELEERVKWSHPCYGRDKINAFSLAYHSNHVNLQLWVGAHLPDPTEIVEGTGKDLRHVKIQSINFEHWDAIQQLMIDSLQHLGWLDSQ